MESTILKQFFEEHHRQWRKKAHSLFQLTCGNLALHSHYSDWLKHQEKKDPDGSSSQSAVNGRQEIL